MSKITFLIIILAFLMHPYYVLAGVNLPWSTTFDCTEQIEGSGSLICDGMDWGGDWSTTNGNRTQVTTGANNPNGGGGRGERHWVGQGSHNNSGGIDIDLNSAQTNIWIRWYMRFQDGKSEAGAYKILYTGVLNGYEVFVANLENGQLYATKLSPEKWYSNTGWGHTFYTGGKSDGSWICMEVHLNTSTGLLEWWVNGTKLVSDTQVTYNNPIQSIRIGGNQKEVPESSDMYIDYDDIAISNTGYIGPISSKDIPEDTTPENSVPEETTPENLLFSESFDDTNFSAREWYDNTNMRLTTTEHISGSEKSVEFHFNTGATMPTSGSAMRKIFTETDQIHVSYYVKYSSNWVGSNTSYHPHEFLIMTNENGAFDSLAYSHLNIYIEQNALRPSVNIQDSANIDTNNVNKNLVGQTEIRAVAGCNGDSDGHGTGDCYQQSGKWKNEKIWRLNTADITKGTWHKVDVYLKLNTISGGVSQKDGTLQYWLDGNILIDFHDIVFRTGQHPNMRFNQFIIAPYIGVGSPIDQTFWVDNLTVATSPPTKTPTVSDFRKAN